MRRSRKEVELTNLDEVLHPAATKTAAWAPSLRAYPKPPALQELVERYGTYSDIPLEAWAEYDAEMAQWHIDRRIYTAGTVIEPVSGREKHKDLVRDVHERRTDRRVQTAGLDIE